MASITSIISLFVLLAVSCYSLPVEKNLPTSTFGNEVTTVGTNFANDNAVNMQLISEDESTSFPINPKITTLFGHGIGKVTTAVPKQLNENVTVLPRSINAQFPRITISGRSIDNELTTAVPKQLNENVTVLPRSINAQFPRITISGRAIGDEVFTTVESSTEFNQRTIRPENMELVKESAVVVLNGTEVQTSTVAEPSETTSAFTNFAQTTGLLQGKDLGVVSTTEELLTTELPVGGERLIKTVAIIPGQITETKIYPNVPSKTVVTADRVQFLSQGQKQPIVKKEESNH